MRPIWKVRLHQKTKGDEMNTEHDLAREHAANERNINAAILCLRIARALPYILTGIIFAMCVAVIVWGAK
jgi:hypothetical protein